MHSLLKNKTWILVNFPEGRQAINLGWVCAHKTNNKMEIVRRKARLVAKGYLQISGVNYHATRANVLKLTTM